MGNTALDSKIEKTPLTSFISDCQGEPDPLKYGVSEIQRDKSQSDEVDEKMEEDENTDFDSRSNNIDDGSDDIESLYNDEKEEFSKMKCGKAKTLNFQNGEFTGETIEIKEGNDSQVREVAHGEGYFNYIGGCKYKGSFQRGKRHGKGKFIYENGAVYAGDWVSNSPCGSGKYIYPNGMYYVGSFKDGVYDGEGKLYVLGDKKKSRKSKKKNTPKRLQYEGYFSKNMKNGIGVYYYFTGSTYLGEFYCDRRHGLGFVEFPNGDEFFGWFYNGGKENSFMKKMFSELQIPIIFSKLIEKRNFRLSMLLDYYNKFQKISASKKEEEEEDGGVVVVVSENLVATSSKDRNSLKNSTSNLEELLESVFKCSDRIQKILEYCEKYRSRILKVVNFRRAHFGYSEEEGLKSQEILLKKEELRKSSDDGKFKYQIYQ